MESVDFVDFFEEMYSEFERHFPVKGDSWKTMDHSEIERLLNQSMVSAMTPLSMRQRMNHLVDIANYCAMSWLRYAHYEPKEKIRGEDE